MKNNYIEFYLNKYEYIDSEEQLNINYIPPLTRRRLSQLDKFSLSTLNQCYNESIDNLVFASKFGEIERLLKIISQYKNEDGVSPAVFSGSVHNYNSGLFLLIKQKTIPYTAISAGEKTFSNGILASVISKNQNTLFCYTDLIEDKYVSLSMNLTKFPSNNSEHYRIIKNQNKNTNDNLKNFIKLFEGKLQTINADCFSLERIK